jgi:hypothetical protein
MIAPRFASPKVGVWPADEIISVPRLIGFHRRVFQIHLCLIYFFSGLTKCVGAGWWNGSNLWRSLTIPPFDRLPTHWVASVGFLLPALVKYRSWAANSGFASIRKIQPPIG